MKSPSVTFTSEFETEFRRERAALLSRRLLWYTGTVGFFYAMATGVRVLNVLEAAGTEAGVSARSVAALIAGVLSGALFWATFAALRRGRTPVHSLGRLVFWLIVTAGVLQLFSGVAGAALGGGKAGALLGFSGAMGILFTHVLAASFLPLQPREAVRPIVPLLALNALITLAYMGTNVAGGLLALCFSLLIGMPGTLICWWRLARLESGFTLRKLRVGYREMRQELGMARQIHEALFPAPIDSGPVRFRFAYEPMRQIGGDYVHVHRDADRLSAVVLDVTGHGIPAALTVNRLHGELERIYAEDPGAGPGEVLRLLNRYVHLTLATHSIYATAFSFRVDPEAETIEYASAGHPPAFVRAIDGTLHELASTSFVLGAASGEDFDPAAVKADFVPGDRVLVYTDGAIEARDPHGKMIGVRGMRGLLSTGEAGGWEEEDLSARVLRSVHAHRSGPPGDDTLIIEVSRPLGGRASAPARPGRGAVALLV